MAAKTHHQTRQKVDFPRFHRDSVPFTPVQFGGDLTLELGLAESLKLLREYQLNAAAKGVDWLAMMQGED